MPCPHTIHLHGRYEQIVDSRVSSGRIAGATAIAHADGRVDILIEDADGESPLEAWLTAAPGKAELDGHIWTRATLRPFEAQAQLRSSPDGDEIQLLGLAHDFDTDDELGLLFSIVLSRKHDA